MVLRLERKDPRLAPAPLLAIVALIAAIGYAGMGQVGQAHRELAEILLDLRQLELGRLEFVTQISNLGQ